MAVNREPILKRCKYLGISPMVMGVAKETKRDPNANKRKKVSEYGLQLKEKQKLRFIYGVLEKQFHHYFEIAQKMEGQAGTNLLTILESRLDSVVFRMGLSMTRREARQLVVHGHFLVNGKRVDIPSYRVKAGDVISLKENSKKSPKFKQIIEATAGRVVPTWLDMDKENQTAKVVRMPVKEDLDYEIEEHLIVELYSK
ncbi:MULTISPECIES: 30S ribosomal protein S4 [Ruminococcus]|jgi:small subunit ribosomal protein S4|uniref:Small ribosomal subunit protein uS4 n=1 Tax=Ruminococcus albus 8 TaxID=246199 RepID=E9SA35_RUMAL|nr:MULTISPECIES: 30S ribosomal protein S4 [Ruminococcus]EGC03913.1 ribosomal protein S4 [Ruminococcus albus 8]MBQ9541733.1 30S ribosomal protein S4 [Ruminococcus sp.]MBR0529265.1 30S ribosomal protein S4 [Ruminococcus sp.]MCC3350487.1 30S ribosomal protein S4 [Ruminococcus albus 8]